MGNLIVLNNEFKTKTPLLNWWFYNLLTDPVSSTMSALFWEMVI